MHAPTTRPTALVRPPTRRAHARLPGLGVAIAVASLALACATLPDEAAADDWQGLGTRDAFARDGERRPRAHPQPRPRSAREASIDAWSPSLRPDGADEGLEAPEIGDAPDDVGEVDEDADEIPQEEDEEDEEGVEDDDDGEHELLSAVEE